MRQERQLKSYLELTSASLLAQGCERKPLTDDLPLGSLVLLLPRGNSRVQCCARQIADSFVRQGGQVVICYEP